MQGKPKMADQQTDAVTEVTPGDSSAPPVTPDVQENQQTVQTEEKTPPFHEHPRWKERTKEIQGLRDELTQLKEGNKPEEEPLTVNQFTPEMQKIVSVIKSETKTEMMEDLKTAQKEQAEKKAAQEKEAEEYLKDLKKKVGSDELFESSFKPFYQDLVKKAQAMTGDANVHVNFETAITQWKATQNTEEGATKVATGSKSGGTSPAKFKSKPGESMDAAADRFLEEGGA